MKNFTPKSEKGCSLFHPSAGRGIASVSAIWLNEPQNVLALQAAVASCVALWLNDAFLPRLLAWTISEPPITTLVTDFSFRWGFPLVLLIRSCGRRAPLSGKKNEVIMACWCIAIVRKFATLNQAHLWRAFINCTRSRSLTLWRNVWSFLNLKFNQNHHRTPTAR